MWITLDGHCPSGGGCCWQRLAAGVWSIGVVGGEHDSLITYERTREGTRGLLFIDRWGGLDVACGCRLGGEAVMYDGRRSEPSAAEAVSPLDASLALEASSWWGLLAGVCNGCGGGFGFVADSPVPHAEVGLIAGLSANSACFAAPLRLDVRPPVCWHVIVRWGVAATLPKATMLRRATCAGVG